MSRYICIVICLIACKSCFLLGPQNLLSYSFPVFSFCYFSKKEVRKRKNWEQMGRVSCFDLKQVLSPMVNHFIVAAFLDPKTPIQISPRQGWIQTKTSYIGWSEISFFFKFHNLKLVFSLTFVNIYLSLIVVLKPNKLQVNQTMRS